MPGIRRLSVWAGVVGLFVLVAMSAGAVALDFGGAAASEGAADGLVLAVAQFEPERIKEDNLARIGALVSEAFSVGADLLVFPEVATTLYPWGVTEEVVDYVEDNAELIPDGLTFAYMSDLAATYEMTICWGMIEAAHDTDRPYNSMVMVGPDGALIGVYRKLHLVPGVETTLFTAGERIEVYDTPLGAVGMLICYDRRFPELARTYALLGAQLLLVGAATTDSSVDEHILATRAYENAAWLLFANQAGPAAGGAGRPFHGGSRIVDPSGRTRAEAITDASELVWTRIEASELSMGRGLLDNRRPDAYADSGALLWASRDEAESLVRAELFPTGGEGHTRHILPEILDGGAQILDWNGVVHVLDAAAWFVFIDDQPGANWEHSCRYVFVDAVTREILVLDGQIPPRRLSEMEPF